MNKLLQRDLKDIIFNLSKAELHTLFENLQNEAGVSKQTEFARNGLRCCECKLKFEEFQSKGYGKDESEALLNSIKNVLESMISSNYKISSITRALKFTGQGKVSKEYHEPAIGNPSTQRKSTSRKTEIAGGADKSSVSKRQLQYNQEGNKENQSKAMNAVNDTINLDLESKLELDASAICINEVNDTHHQTQPKSQKKNREPQKGESGTQHRGQCTCVYYDVHAHTKEEVKSLSARIKLLQDQNRMLKELLLKDFDSEYFKNGKKQLPTLTKNSIADIET